MSVEHSTMAAMILIAMAVGARIATTALLAGRQKDLSEITAQLRTARAELGFAKERTKAASDVVSFNERQKRDLIDQIQYAREELKIIELETEAETKKRGDDESGDRADPKLPRHMRPREGI